MERAKRFLKTTFEKIYIEEFFIALYLGIVVMLQRNPLSQSDVKVNSFNRQIGPGVVEGSDIAKMVSNFNKWFLLCVLITLVVYVILVAVREKRKNSLNIWNYIQKWLPFAYVVLCLKCTNYFYVQLNESSEAIFFASDFVAVIITLLTILYVLDAERKISFTWIELALVGALSSSIPLAMLFDNSGELWNAACITLLLAFIIWICLFFVLSYRLEDIKVTAVGNVLVIFMAFFLVLTFVYIEMINVLNQYEVFINRPFLGYQIGASGYFCIMIIAGMLTTKKSYGIFNDWKKLTYPVVVSGFQALAIQFNLQAMYAQDLMESANSGVLISNFFVAGRLPVVETYGGHQLEKVLEGIVYGIVNQDYAGAVFSPYAAFVNVVIALFLYLVLKNIFDRETAFFFVLFVPYYSNVFYWGIGLLVVLTFLKFINKQSIVNVVLLWLSCIFCVLYRLDLGYSFTLAMLLTLCCYVIMEKKWQLVKNVFIPLLIIGISGVTLWCILCLTNGINPIERLIEFLQISLSNHVWGRASIGDEGKMMYAVAYIILPISILSLVIYMLLKGKTLCQEYGKAYYLCIMIGFAYLMNFSRGIVRHSMYENITYVAFWCGLLFLAITFTLYSGKKSMLGVFFVGVVLINHMLLGQGNYTEQPVLTKAVTRENEFVKSWKQEENNYWGLLQERVQRTQWSDELKENALSLQTICNLFLDEEETYAELLNKDFLYAVLQRENPWYMCQAPLMVSGDYTQEMLIEQLEQKKCPIILLPSATAEGFEVQTDAISNNVKNYKIVEYVYQNYCPLLCYQDTAVWCLPERLEEYRDIAKEYMKNAMPEEEGDVSLELVDYGYDLGTMLETERAYYPFLHQYNLGELAWIWGNFDEQKAYENEVIANVTIDETQLYRFDSVKEDEKKNGNYLLIQMDMPNDGELIFLEMGICEESGFQEMYEFVYHTDCEHNQYLIRISSDYYWYIEDINAIRIRNEEGKILNNVKMSILSGD